MTQSQESFFTLNIELKIKKKSEFLLKINLHRRLTKKISLFHWRLVLKFAKLYFSNFKIPRSFNSVSFRVEMYLKRDIIAQLKHPAC